MRPAKESLFALFSLCILAGCARTPAEESADLATASQALAPDPSTASQHGWCADSRTYGGIHGDIRYPANGNCNASVYSPLVVLLHGTGYDHDTYDYLLEHLATNGFIAVSIDVLGQNGGEHAGAVTAATGYMESLWNSWPKSVYIDPSKVGIIGHSRGGGTARHLADALKGGADRWTVRAIIGLASVNWGELDVTREMAPAFMAIHAGDDPDQMPARSFELYDDAGTEGSITSAHPDALYKSMKLLQNGTHRDFTEWNGGESEQAQVTKGYALAFLAAHLKGDTTWYEDYIRADNVPHGWSQGQVVSQVSDGFLRSVIDHFEDGEVSTATNGGSVLLSVTDADIVDLAASADSSHHTQALSLFGFNQDSFVRWTLPVAQRDTRPFKYLSFRIGQRSGVQADDLRVQIRNDLVWSPEVRVTDHGTIPMPMEMCDTIYSNNAVCQGYDVVDHMGTVRIPLSAFKVDPEDEQEELDNVTYVRFRFRGDSVWKSFLVDSLELSEWIHKP